MENIYIYISIFLKTSYYILKEKTLIIIKNKKFKSILLSKQKKNNFFQKKNLKTKNFTPKPFNFCFFIKNITNKKSLFLRRQNKRIITKQKNPFDRIGDSISFE